MKGGIDLDFAVSSGGFGVNKMIPTPKLGAGDLRGCEDVIIFLLLRQYQALEIILEIWSERNIAETFGALKI